MPFGHGKSIETGDLSQPFNEMSLAHVRAAIFADAQLSVLSFAFHQKKYQFDEKVSTSTRVHQKLRSSYFKSETTIGICSTGDATLLHISTLVQNTKHKNWCFWGWKVGNGWKWMMDVFIFSFSKVHAEGSDQTMGPGFLELRHLTLCILSMQQQQDQQDHTHSQSIVFLLPEPF